MQPVDGEASSRVALGRWAPERLAPCRHSCTTSPNTEGRPVDIGERTPRRPGDVALAHDEMKGDRPLLWSPPMAPGMRPSRQAGTSESGAASWDCLASRG